MNGSDLKGLSAQTSIGFALLREFTNFKSDENSKEKEAGRKTKTKETQDRRQRKKQNKGIRRDDSPQMTRQRTSQHHMAQDESTSHDSTTDHKYHIHLFKMSCRTPAFSELEVPFLEEVLQDMRF